MKLRYLGIAVAVCLPLGIWGCESPPPDGGGANANANDNQNDNGSANGNDNDNAADTSAACAMYCEFIQAACGEADDFTAQYEDNEECMAHCITWAAWPAGESGDESGNTVACRFSHAQRAAAAEGALERQSLCEIAGPSGGDTCGSWCENYCYLSMLNCPDDPLHPADETACLAACSGFNTQGRPGTETGLNVQCRIELLGRAGNPEPVTDVDGSDPPLDDSGEPITTYAAWYCPQGAPVSTNPDGSAGPCN